MEHQRLFTGTRAGPYQRVDFGIGVVNRFAGKFFAIVVDGLRFRVADPQAVAVVTEMVGRLERIAQVVNQQVIGFHLVFMAKQLECDAAAGKSGGARLTP